MTTPTISPFSAGISVSSSSSPDSPSGAATAPYVSPFAAPVIKEVDPDQFGAANAPDPAKERPLTGRSGADEGSDMPKTEKEAPEGEIRPFSEGFENFETRPDPIESSKYTPAEKEKLAKVAGRVPPWWPRDPDKGSYFYGAVQAIKKTGCSAEEVHLAVEKDYTSKELTLKEKTILSAGWPGVMPLFIEKELLSEFKRLFQIAMVPGDYPPRQGIAAERWLLKTLDKPGVPKQIAKLAPDVKKALIPLETATPEEQDASEEAARRIMDEMEKWPEIVPPRPVRKYPDPVYPLPFRGYPYPEPAKRLASETEDGELLKAEKKDYPYPYRYPRPMRGARYPEPETGRLGLGRFRRFSEGMEGEVGFDEKKFNPESTGYDYKTAIASGGAPDKSGHWSSLDPRTGMVLKGRKHKTWDLMEKEEKRLGNKIIKRGKRYYSVSEKTGKFELVPDVEKKKKRFSEEMKEFKETDKREPYRRPTPAQIEASRKAVVKDLLKQNVPGIGIMWILLTEPDSDWTRDEINKFLKNLGEKEIDKFTAERKIELRTGSPEWQQLKKQIEEWKKRGGVLHARLTGKPVKFEPYMPDIPKEVELPQERLIWPGDVQPGTFLHVLWVEAEAKKHELDIDRSEDLPRRDSPLTPMEIESLRRASIDYPEGSDRSSQIKWQIEHPDQYFPTEPYSEGIEGFVEREIKSLRDISSSDIKALAKEFSMRTATLNRALKHVMKGDIDALTPEQQKAVQKAWPELFGKLGERFEYRGTFSEFSELKPFSESITKGEMLGQDNGFNVFALTATEKEELLALLKGHGTKENPTRASWGGPCKASFKSLTGLPFSLKAVRKAWGMV